MPIMNIPVLGGGGGSKAIINQLTITPADWSNTRPYTCEMNTLPDYVNLGIKTANDAVGCTIIPMGSTYLGDVESFSNLSNIKLEEVGGVVKMTAYCNEVRPSGTMVLQFTVFPA